MNLTDNDNTLSINTCDITCGIAGKRVVVGLSGGADSVALTHYLKFALSCEVYACHVNHKLRGEESVRDMEFVKLFCGKYDIPLFIKEADISAYAKEKSISVEEAGREVRYDFFEVTRGKINADYIATAHTLSDNAETLLLNLTRGTALSGLCGIPAVRGRIIRPLINSTRADIEEYCQKNSLEYVTDSTNNLDIYSRNNIRNNVIPVLKQINPAFESSVLRCINAVKADNDCLDRLAKRLFEECKIKQSYSVVALKNADVALRHRVIGKILEENNIAKGFDLILSIDGIIATSKGKINIAKNVYASHSGSVLTIGEEKKPLEYFEDELFLGEYTPKSGEIYRISKYDEQTFEYTKKVYKNLLYTLIDYDKIIGKAFIRQRKPSDEIELAGRNGTKSLKKLFIEKKLNQYEKSKTLVLADEVGVVGVCGFGVSKRVAIDENTKTILEIERL